MRTAVAALEAVSDVALYIAPDGAIEDVHWSNCSISLIELKEWVGRPWAETVTIECRQKIADLLRESATTGITGWREINQVLPNHRQLPMRYCVIGLGQDGRAVAIGRDLAAVSALQQQVIAAQQSAERELARARLSETRYQLLFQSVGEAVLIAEAWSLKVVEANAAANVLVEGDAKRLVGRTLLDILPGAFEDDVRGALEQLRVNGKSDAISLAGDAAFGSYLLSASLYRQTRETQILVRLVPTHLAAHRALDDVHAKHVSNAMQIHPEAFVLTDGHRNIIKANEAFLEMVQLAVERQVVGQPIDRWLGRPGVDVPLMMTSLREETKLRNLNTVVFGELGQIEDVQVSAVRHDGKDGDVYGFLIREVTLETVSGGTETGLLSRSAEEMSELVGRVPLKELLRETTDIIEKLCIESALQLTNDNRASAAEMLGLSRQSLYSKMRRFGIGDRDSDVELKDGGNSA